MKTVNVKGKTFRIPFADLFRELNDTERTGLAASIEANGIKYAVIVYDSQKWGSDCVIDGANRLGIAAGLDIDVPTTFLTLGNDDQARELAKSLNRDRRHLTPAEQSAARSERVERVAEKRTQGKTLQTIADEEKVSIGQVQRDLKDAEDSGLSGDKPEPEKVKDKRGREQPAKKKPGSQKPGRKPKPKAGETITITEDDEKEELARRKKSPAPKDEVGQVIPTELRDTFLDPELGQAIEELKALLSSLDDRYQRILKSLSHKPYKFCQFGKATHDLSQVVNPQKGYLALAIGHLEAGVPYAVCSCGGKNTKHEDCRNGGYLPKWRYDELQAEVN